MSTDESGAPWPYEDVEAIDDQESEPTWECPGGECACHPPPDEQEEPEEHRVVLFDHLARRMPGARCRVLENGRLLNDDSPYADGDGAVSVKVRASTRYLRVEWAPPDLPQKPRYPFRKLYHLDLGDTQDDGVARRLHNIGYSIHSALGENVGDFQRTYLQRPTGEPADVETQLVAFHDAAALPPVPPASARKGSSETLEKRSLVAGEGDSAGEGGSAKAKEGPGDKPAVPGAVPGKGKQGSVSGVQTTKVKIELHIAFALREEDFVKTDVAWTDMPYDPVALLDEIYPKGRKRDFRIGAKGAFPIADATLTRMEIDSSETFTTRKDGSVVVDLGNLEGKSTTFIFRVEPPPGQLNTTDKPAGPALTDEKTDVPFLFRRFSLWFEVDADGALLPDSVKTIHPPGHPRHAKIIQVAKGVRSGENIITVDWRPDWMSSGKETSRRLRQTDRVNTPKNPFDLSISVEDRLAACPPAVIIHQTGTTNLNFLPGFISDKNKDKTSIHYVVDYDGFVIKVLDEFYRANHGGFSLWEQRLGLNSFSIGIETMHSDTDPPSPTTSRFGIKPRRYTKEQYDSFVRLLGELVHRPGKPGQEYPIFRRRLRGHMEVLATKILKKDADGKVEIGADGQPVVARQDGVLSRERVGCPGPYFEWQRLEEGEVSLAPVTVPDKAPDASLESEFADLAKLEGVTSIKAGAKSPEAKIVKQLLFDIGYSVSKDLPNLAKRDDVKRLRQNLSDEYDTAAQEAVRAFQTHHFSGRRRAYNIFNTKGETAWPRAGTLDAATIQAITETWYAAVTSTR